MPKSRPTIPSITSTASSPEEQFQNQTLRPIIKMQHDLLIAYFRHYLIIRKTDFQTFSVQKKLAFIDNSLKTDNRLRSELKGLIIGHFTIEEYQAYLDVQRDVNKRIYTIVGQRWRDSLEAL